MEALRVLSKLLKAYFRDSSDDYITSNNLATLIDKAINIAIRKGAQACQNEDDNSLEKANGRN